MIGRSYGGETVIELALGYPDRVRALVLLEAAWLTLDDEAMTWADELPAAIEEAAARDVSAVAETFLRRVVGDEAWESFPDPLRQMLVGNSPAILAEFRGPWLEATAADLGRIGVPTLLLAAEESPPALRRVTDLMAAAIPNSRLVLVGGGHFIDPGEPEVLKFVADLLG